MEEKEALQEKKRKEMEEQLSSPVYYNEDYTETD